MKTITLSIMTVLCMSGCNAQENKSGESTKESLQAKPQPKESWSVDKEVDEYGNITRYDSTYTWSYSNMEGDSVSIDVDSVMRSFNNYFNRNFPSIWGQGFMSPMWNDSLFHRDFFMDDYFHRRWRNDFFDMDGMMQRMDSLHHRFFMENYPGAVVPQESEKEKSKKK